MSVLNQLFNRGLLGSKCKTCLTLAISRIKLLQNKRDVQLRLMRKEIAEFLQAGQESIARIRVTLLIKLEILSTFDTMWSMSYESRTRGRRMKYWSYSANLFLLVCQFLKARELREAVASIIFSAPSCSDLPDLLQVRNLFATKYGKEFIAAASELRPDTSVNRTIIEKLSVSAPPGDVKLKILKAIAREHNVNWDSTKTEQEFSKKPEDLLNGPKPTAAQPRPDSRPEVRWQHSTTSQSSASVNGNLQSPTSLSSVSSVEAKTVKSSNTEQTTKPKNETKNLNPESSDALQRARNAINAAERATAAARAAAELVNARFMKEERRT